jgi:hypothetical protein
MLYFNTLPSVLSSDNAGNLIILKNLLARVHLNRDTIKNPLLFYSYDIQEGDTPEIVAQKYYGSVDYFWVVMFGGQLIDPEWDWPMSSRVFSEFIIDKYGSITAANSLVDHYEKIITISSSLNNDHTTDIVVIDANTYTDTIVETHSYNVPTESPTATGIVGANTIIVSSSTGLNIGQTVIGAGIGFNAKVTRIVGTTITLSVVNSGTVSGTVVFSGETVTISTDKRPVTAYENEILLNEKKRSINLINQQYVPDISQQLKILLNPLIK